MRDLDLSTVEIKKGILIEPVEESEFEYYFDLAIQSESMEGIERELESYGIEIDPATDCPTDIYILLILEGELLALEPTLLFKQSLSQAANWPVGGKKIKKDLFSMSACIFLMAMTNQLEMHTLELVIMLYLNMS